jgi:hypothetical protein
MIVSGELISGISEGIRINIDKTAWGEVDYYVDNRNALKIIQLNWKQDLKSSREWKNDCT